jgi:IS30 family transposase
MGNQHLNINKRMILQGCLCKSSSCKEIVERLKLNRTTIYREIMVYSVIKNCNRVNTNCLLNKTCCYKGIRGSGCLMCDDFQEIKCQKLKYFPYVCNECEKKNKCPRTKRYYDFQEADETATKIKRGNRQKLKVSQDKLKMIDTIVSGGLDKGQGLHHIYVNNTTLQIVTERTIRNYINNNYFRLSSAFLPNFGSFDHTKSKKDKRIRRKITAEIIDRMYVNYAEYIKKNPNQIIVQIDSVIGKKTDKQNLLTIHFPAIHFQVGFLYNNSSHIYVLEILKRLMGVGGVMEMVTLILTDNGNEFAEIISLEKVEDTIKRRVFFCDPYTSCQKGACEKNHEFIRRVIYKGKSLDNYSQEDMNILFSHINSYHRESLIQTPYQLAKEQYGVEFLEALNISEIEPSDVCLKPQLLLKVHK